MTVDVIIPIMEETAEKHAAIKIASIALITVRANRLEDKIFEPTIFLPSFSFTTNLIS